MMRDQVYRNRDDSTPTLSRRARLQALLFTAASIGTTLLTLGVLADVKLPRNQGE